MIINNNLTKRKLFRTYSMNSGNGIVVRQLEHPIFRDKEGHELFVHCKLLLLERLQSYWWTATELLELTFLLEVASSSSRFGFVLVKVEDIASVPIGRIYLRFTFDCNFQNEREWIIY